MSNAKVDDLASEVKLVRNHMGLIEQRLKAEQSHSLDNARKSLGPKDQPMNKIPSSSELFNPTLIALKALGGSGSIKEICDKVAENSMISNHMLETLHNPETSNQTVLEYRLGWTRTYLKKYGLIENSTRGIWSLTEKAKDVHEVDPLILVREVELAIKLKKLTNSMPVKAEEMSIAEPFEETTWRTALYKILTKELQPAAFERLVQRILRESGFIQVEVMGKSGDGGIDGKGIARIHGLMSFHVIFQCKRYQGVVSAGEIRDFRGAMVGRADKGLFMTTGTFTRDAVKEATRDGAPPIDLFDGDQIIDKLKELRLGVKVEMVESVSVSSEWFTSI